MELVKRLGFLRTILRLYSEPEYYGLSADEIQYLRNCGKYLLQVQRDLAYLADKRPQHNNERVAAA